MTQTRYLAAASSLALAFISAPADAATYIFTGSATATPSNSADPTCAPLPFRSVVTASNSSGTSNLGAFTISSSACISGATAPRVAGLVNGVFRINFAEDSISGVFSGTSLARSGVAGLFDQSFTYTVNEGTGLYAGALGTFTNIGTVDVRGGPPSRLTLNLNGSFSTPAVPEPATWAMMILGFGLVCGTLRSRKQVALA